MPPFPAGVEMSEAEDQYNVATYSSPKGNRIRVTADINIDGAKKLVKILENRIKMIEDEEAAN